MPRIVAGRFGGRRLVVPPSGTRPTSDRAREGVFSTLEALLGGLDGVRFLDLYAGSGAVGLEAVSRGAAEAVFVESAPAALRVLRANIASVVTDAGRQTPMVVSAKTESVAGELPASGFDVIFADPPYDLPSTALADVVRRLVSGGALRPGGIVVVERASRDAWLWPDGVEPLRERRYGDATVWYGRAARHGADQSSS